MIPDEISEPSILDLKKGEDIFRCGKCGYILLIELKKKNNSIEIITTCRNNHKNIYSLNDFLKETSKNNLNFVCCSQCKCERNNNNIFYYCFHCKSFFCEKCQINHINTVKNNNIISLDNLDSYCGLHNDKIIAFYEINNEYKNLCLQCINMMKNRTENIPYLSLITNEEKIKINDKFVEEQNLIKTYEKEIEQLEIKLKKLKESKNNLEMILEIEKLLYNFSIKECAKKKYCYEILRNVRNILNFKFKQYSQEKIISPEIENKNIFLEKINIPLNKIICKNEKCRQILQITDENYSLVTLNLSQSNNNEIKKDCFYYISLYGITSTIQNNISIKLSGTKDINNLLFKSHNHNIKLSSSEFFHDKINQSYFIYPINNSYDIYIRLYLISKNKVSDYPRILLIKKNISFINFQKQIFFYLRNYLILPEQNEYEELKNKLNNIDSFYYIFSFINKEYLKLVNNDEFRKNLPFKVFMQNKEEDKYILWDSNNFGNKELKTNDSIDGIINKILNENYDLCVIFNNQSNYINKNEELDKIKKNNLENNLIHMSLDKNSNNKILICPYCNTINQFTFNKKLSNYYIFIFDKTINYHAPLFLENNQGIYFLYEKDEIKNEFILSHMNKEKLNELIKSQKIVCFKKRDSEKLTTLLDEIIKKDT